MKAWWSKGLGHGVRVIASKSGVRPAYRGRYGQVSTRSTFLRLPGGFKVFGSRKR